LNNINQLAPYYTKLRRKTKPDNYVFTIFFNMLHFPDGHKLGKRTGETARKILSGISVAEIPEMEASDATLNINYMIAEKMGIRINLNAGTGSGQRYHEMTLR
jgi:hypothetical protein